MNRFSGKRTTQHEGIIKNQLFWPDIDIGKFCEDYRTPNELNQGTIKEHLSHAMAEINIQLMDYRHRKMDEGFDHLKDVPAETIGDESRLLMLYRRAVSCRCKAVICRDYPTIDRREPAENQAKSSQETEYTNLCNSDKAVRAFLELSDISVDVI
ncbi:head completion/stabilization protein [Bacterioplanoides sp.]|uniref:head completion/stabilization protein n=1 Tax=Bacterioplanoides sp. TaxID=2066072 RepID=UPI003B5CBEF1